MAAYNHWYTKKDGTEDATSIYSTIEYFSDIEATYLLTQGSGHSDSILEADKGKIRYMPISQAGNNLYDSGIRFQKPDGTLGKVLKQVTFERVSGGKIYDVGNRGFTLQGTQTNQFIAGRQFNAYRPNGSRIYYGNVDLNPPEGKANAWQIEFFFKFLERPVDTWDYSMFCAMRDEDKYGILITWTTNRIGQSNVTDSHTPLMIALGRDAYVSDDNGGYTTNQVPITYIIDTRTGIDVADGNWHHVVISQWPAQADGRRVVVVMLDGASVIGSYMDIGNTFDHMWLGGRHDNYTGANYGNGKFLIDSFRITYGGLRYTSTTCTVPDVSEIFVNDAFCKVLHNFEIEG